MNGKNFEVNTFFFESSSQTAFLPRQGPASPRPSPAPPPPAFYWFVVVTPADNE